MRVKITLRCNECKQRNYNTVTKNTLKKLRFLRIFLNDGGFLFTLRPFAAGSIRSTRRLSKERN